MDLGLLLHPLLLDLRHGFAGHGMLRDVHLVALPGADDTRAFADEHPLRDFARRQLTLLFSRHAAEDVILVRVLVESYQHAAVTAKNGQIAQARSELASLARGVTVPPHDELVRVVNVAALPARALVTWLSGDHDSARTDLLTALDACADLAERWGHDYLTMKQLHLAVNIARLAISEGHHVEAEALLRRVRSVANGTRDDWPFAGAALLNVPLPVLERAAIEGQVDRAASHLAGLRG